MVCEEASKRISKLFLAGMLLCSASAGPGWAEHTHHNGKITYDHYAYINKRGNIVFKTPLNAESENFSDGYLKITSKTVNDVRDSSYVDKDGKPIVGKFIRGGQFSCGLAEIGNLGKIGFIDNRGAIAIPQVLSNALCFRESLAPVMINKGFGFIDRAGDIVVDPFFENASEFSEGLAAVQSQGKIGFIDKAGKWRIMPQFDYVDGFSDGLALVKADGDEFFIDRDGRKVFALGEGQVKHPFVFWKISDTGLSSRISIFKGFNSRTFASLFTFVDGLCPMYKDKKYGYVNKSGQFVIQAKYQVAYPFVEGRARVCVDNKYGFIDKFGKVVVEPKFCGAEDFSEDVAAVATGHNRWGCIDTEGNCIVKPKYLFVSPFHDGRARVQLTGCYDDHIQRDKK